MQLYKNLSMQQVSAVSKQSIWLSVVWLSEKKQRVNIKT